jgi:hypothetical protein
MSHAPRRRPPLAAIALAGFLGYFTPASAQQPVEQAVAQQQSGQVTVSQDARQTRQELEAILKRFPPAVGRVLRTDPSLMRNQSYLATYPALATFLQQHAEVVNNPGYYLENINTWFWEPPQPRDARAEAISMWRNVMEMIAIGFVFLTITGGVLWLVKSALEYRKWHRTFKIQSEVHTKLLDRFTANEDLLAYIQTPVGRRFLESAPLPVETAAAQPPPAAPFNRILWSVQVGLVLMAGALGLLFISRRVIEEVAQVVLAGGVLALALGVGFVASAAASFLLSRRLGLLSPVPREHSGPTGA